MKKYIVQLEILESGDGLIKLSDEVVAAFHLKAGDKLELLTQKDGVSLVVPTRGEFQLNKLLEGINEDNLHGEIDLGDPVGDEII
ncbi:AbrB/MazE/SpoVT family DNA-binding domain-containing protein [Saccharicrinis aurantiacus]|uniref:AbrB/MazE/SpoVT family DNA-binding domain-containing protein n=1 Tax=Saccharicrinis aurantiacus TaxID=1849719 RepID=UPI00095003EC|nr:hypothetical protein [Saccharicrinis aurantiacus]